MADFGEKVFTFVIIVLVAAAITVGFCIGQVIFNHITSNGKDCIDLQHAGETADGDRIVRVVNVACPE